MKQPIIITIIIIIIIIIIISVLKGTGTENLSFDSLSSFSAPVVALQFSGCGQYLAASCEDKTLKVWSLSDLKEIAKW